MRLVIKNRLVQISLFHVKLNTFIGFILMSVASKKYGIYK